MARPQVRSLGDAAEQFNKMAENLMRIGWEEAHDLFCDFAPHPDDGLRHPPNPHNPKEG